MFSQDEVDAATFCEPHHLAADVLGRKGVPNRVDAWGAEWEHDWATWREMLPQYGSSGAAGSATRQAMPSAKVLAGRVKLRERAPPFSNSRMAVPREVRPRSSMSSVAFSATR